MQAKLTEDKYEIAAELKDLKDKHQKTVTELSEA